MHSFFCDDITSPLLSLSEEESAHASRVLRLRAGDKVLLLDGKGRSAVAAVLEPHPKKCMLEIQGSVYEEKAAIAGLHIAMAPTKNIDRFEWFLEKATEIGIKRITPILTSNSERKVINQERLQKILVSAMKQSQRLFLPQLDELTHFQKLLEQSKLLPQKYIAHCEETEKRFFKDELQHQVDTVLLIGPEGDFSSQEIHSATAVGFIPVSLGKARLRTETAGVYAVSIYNS